jgi:hypothetical protein
MIDVHHVHDALEHPRLFSRGVGAPGPGSPLIYADLTRSPTWAAVEQVLLTLRQYPDATVTVTVLGTMVEYSLRPFAATPYTVPLEGQPTPAAESNVLDLRRM